MVPPCLRLFFIAGEFRRLRAASFFLDGQKETKKPPGGGRNQQERLRRPCLHAAHPWTPILRGPPIRQDLKSMQRRGWFSRLPVPRLPLPLTWYSPRTWNSPSRERLCCGEAQVVRWGMADTEAVPSFVGASPRRPTGGPMWPPLRVKRTALITGTVPLIRLAFGQPPSPRGRLVLPALARLNQAQLWNRIDRNFRTARPQWARIKRRGHSDFARRKFCKIQQVRVPRNGGPGVSRHWRTKCASAASPGDPLGTFPSLGKYLAPQGETFLQQMKLKKR